MFQKGARKKSGEPRRNRSQRRRAEKCDARATEPPDVANYVTSSLTSWLVTQPAQSRSGHRLVISPRLPAVTAPRLLMATRSAVL
jgi:hypothetical protein